MLRKKRLLLAGALLVVGGAAVGIAYAAIPNGGVINGCYATSNGSLRVIDPTSSTCKSSETALNWDAHGTQGPSGATGAYRAGTGATGADGCNGVDRRNRRFRPPRCDRADGSRSRSASVHRSLRIAHG